MKHLLGKNENPLCVTDKEKKAFVETSPIALRKYLRKYARFIVKKHIAAWY